MKTIWLDEINTFDFSLAVCTTGTQTKSQSQESSEWIIMWGKYQANRKPRAEILSKVKIYPTTNLELNEFSLNRVEYIVVWASKLVLGCDGKSHITQAGTV